MGRIYSVDFRSLFIVMKNYPAYKDSGIEWYGDIPEHWEMINIKFLLIQGRDGIKIGPFGSALKLDMLVEEGRKVYGQENVIRNDFSLGQRFISYEYFNEMKQYEIIPNDLLITMMGTTGKSKIVPSGIKQGIMDSHLIRLRIDKNKFLPKYLSRIIEDCYSVGQNIYLLGKGSIMHGLNSSIIKAIKIPTPNIQEQTAIANFLDHKIQQIDELIAKKQRLIELLKEERTAVINQAVTKGLDPDVPMKDSGIEWLGEIPEYWEVKSLKYLLQEGKEGIKIGPFGSSLRLDLLIENGIKVYGQENVINDDFTIGHRYISEEYFTEMSQYEILPNDIVITMMGTTGKSKIVPEIIQKGIMDSHLLRLRIDEKYFIPVFLSLIINDSYSIGQNIFLLGKGSIMHGLNSSIIKSIKIPVAPKQEQGLILNHIREEEIRMNTIIENSSREIDLLIEYKSSLINETVTGKIDVFEYQFDHDKH